MSALEWVTTQHEPGDWLESFSALGGVFHHSPKWLGLAPPDAEPVFGMLCRGADTIGVALGVRRRCRFSRRARHFYFPTLPALRRDCAGDDALAGLAEHLHRCGAAELRLGSFEARWVPGTRIPAGRSRFEFVAQVTSDPDGLLERCGTTHRRRIRRGEREGWELRRMVGREAVTVLRAVQEQASERVGARGVRFAPRVPLETMGAHVDDLSAQWGASTFAVWADGGPLAAALVGWGGGHGFYVCGGSTAEGYRRSAAAWLHWRIMCLLAEHGFAAYNLGGVPGSANESASPHHGLYRFKAGFGAEVFERRGVHWFLRGGHQLGHRVVLWGQRLVGDGRLGRRVFDVRAEEAL